MAVVGASAVAVVGMRRGAAARAFAPEGGEWPRRGWLLPAGAAALVLLLATGTPAMADDGGDWFQPFVDLNASLISGINGVIGSAGVSILLYTVLLKVVTLPITNPATRTSAVLNLVAPQREYIQAKFKDDEQKSNKLQRQLYAEVDINPVSAILPIFIQLPVFIALFRAVGQLAKTEPSFQQPFLFIPTLSGPAEVGRPSLDWLLRSKSAQAFEPLVGWENVASYLALPLIVVATQIFVQSRTSSATKSGDADVVQVLFPIVVGISCLVSPAGLGLYWLANNVVTAAQTEYIRSSVNKEFPKFAKIREMDLEDVTPETLAVIERSVDEIQGEVYVAPTNKRIEKAKAKQQEKLEEQMQRAKSREPQGKGSTGTKSRRRSKSRTR